MENDNAAAGAAATATTTNADGQQVDNYGFPVDELSTEGMSDDQLDAYVDKVLGSKTSRYGTAAKPGRAATDTKPTDDAGAATLPAPGTVVTPTAPAKAPEADKATPTPPPAAPVEPEAPIEVPTLDTSDLWIEVTDADGNKVKLTLDEGIPEEMRFTTDKQLFEVLDAFNEMRDLRTQREAAIADAQAKKDAQVQGQQTEQATFAEWDAEISALIESGAIPAAKTQPADGKRYTEAELNADPGPKLISDTFAYMVAENQKRDAAGKPRIKSFATAFTLMSRANASSEEAKRQEEANKLAKQRGSIVGGGGATASVTNGKGYVYRRGSARTIRDLDLSDI